MRLIPTVMVAVLVAAASANAAQLKCAADAVKVGNACIDKYEASVWAIDPADKSLVKKVQAGKGTLDLLTDEGATQISPAGTCTPAFPMNFPATGNWTPVADSDPPSPGVSAVSIPGVKPSACVTWFQAEQACALSGKRLATNQEWQQAAAGTPDGAPCVVSVMVPANTGGNPGCVSNWGAFDMVGNVWERVSHWGDQANGSGTWSERSAAILWPSVGPAPDSARSWARCSVAGSGTTARLPVSSPLRHSTIRSPRTARGVSAARGRRVPH